MLCISANQPDWCVIHVQPNTHFLNAYFNEFQQSLHQGSCHHDQDPEHSRHSCLVAITRASLEAQLVKNPPAMQETLVWFLDQEDLLEKE